MSLLLLLLKILVIAVSGGVLLQNSVIPNLLVCVVSCGANAVLHYGLVYQADMGIKSVTLHYVTLHCEPVGVRGELWSQCSAALRPCLPGRHGHQVSNITLRYITL